MSELAHIWGEPIVIKDVPIYPVKLTDSEQFYKLVYCLLYEKNKMQDIEIIKMSYLKFLFVLATSSNEKEGFAYVIDDLRSLLRMTLKNDVHFNVTSDRNLQIIVGDGENQATISESDFEEIRKTICKQNLIHLNEIILDEEIEKAIIEAREFMSKRNKSATLEEQIVAYHCLSGVTYEEIKKYTIYQFNKGLERFQIIKNFEVYSSLLVEHGSKDIQHWLCHIDEKGMYDDVLINRDEIDKMTSDPSFAK